MRRLEQSKDEEGHTQSERKRQPGGGCVLLPLLPQRDTETLVSLQARVDRTPGSKLSLLPCSLQPSHTFLESLSMSHLAFQ